MTKECLTGEGTLHMMFTLGDCADTVWEGFRDFQYPAGVIKGLTFADGIEGTKLNPVTA